ncbi:MAG: hypothetical protein JRF08_08115 [Deltaproteobacteria bacterium]|nr:hypothetical protein [Deltaproteobacteria bacterium]OQY14339.1 MAG: hypothetical protein B6I32_09345 [Desulfobacterium sp. 4572_20]RLJ03270.1 MAG: hypothetical protein DRP14_05130 [Candidatus Aenigmarchaeota archaeon]HDH87960.1 hypothetical protein [Desulfobacteraceae bacterium]MBW2106415.1 hypothetical protein [Deltaproteobacteria bacterium]
MEQNFKKVLTIMSLLILCSVFLTSGCSKAVKTLDQGIKGPQIIVNPGTVRLGVARMKGTKIVFSGSGFEPGDSVFIKLLNVPVNGKKVDLSVAAADVDKNGRFNAKVGILTKISDFLRAKLGSNEKMENIIIVTKPPMPAGAYTAQAVSMLSDKKAECTLNVKGPSLIDRLKDWVGTLLGKIVKK